MHEKQGRARCPKPRARYRGEGCDGRLLAGPHCPLRLQSIPRLSSAAYAPGLRFELQWGDRPWLGSEGPAKRCNELRCASWFARRVTRTSLRLSARLSPRGESLLFATQPRRDLAEAWQVGPDGGHARRRTLLIRQGCKRRSRGSPKPTCSPRSSGGSGGSGPARDPIRTAEFRQLPPGQQSRGSGRASAGRPRRSSRDGSSPKRRFRRVRAPHPCVERAAAGAGADWLHPHRERRPPDLQGEYDLGVESGHAGPPERTGCRPPRCAAKGVFLELR